jgi:glycosyltransferase involved in cell wall biosynthesis
MIGSDLPLVTIGLPTYNRVGKLERALGSALAQDYGNLEIVISDNASSDDTESFCRRTAEREARVRYVRQPRNRGAYANFRGVFNDSRGEFFMWLGDDDWISPTYVTACLRAFAPDVGVVCGFDRYFNDGEFSFEGPRLTLLADDPEERLLSYYRQVTVNGTFYGVMRRRLLAQIVPPDAMGGDWVMMAAMAYLGKIKTLDDVSVCRDVGGESTKLGVLARKLGMSEFYVRNPFLAVARHVFRDLAWESSVYGSLGPVARLRLAARAAGTVVARHYTPRQGLTVARHAVEELISRARA